MCTIEKMLVKGIRSFSPDNNNVIEFYKPLTLIVGSNGAGKTTIIECLKQATTGELPPNVGGNGRNWVMDPKVAAESEVKAQIKLRLRTGTGMPCVVVRSFQNVQKKATLQFKSLDATLQTYNKDTNKKEAITYRCADINAMVPTLMGVSKAVLDNVIFVHQEESNWPLADGATIKKKFDDIFAATKYTKALETLRKLRLEKTQEVREMKLKLESLKAHKDQAQAYKAEVDLGTAKAEQLTQEIQTLQDGIDTYCSEMSALDAKLNQIADVADEVTRLKAQLEVLSAAASDKLMKLDGGDYEDSDEDLENFLNGLKQQEADAASRREERSNELRMKQMDAASYEERLQQGQQQLSRLQAAADAHASNVADRDAFVTSTAAKMGIQLPGAAAMAAASSAATAAGEAARVQLPSAALDAFLSELRSRQAQLQSQLAQQQQEHRAQEDDLNGRIDSANTELARAQQAGAVKAQDLGQLERRRENLNEQVVAMAAAPYQAEGLRLQEEDLQRKLEAKKSEETRHNFEGQLQQQKAELERIAAAMSNLRAERDRLIMAGDAAARHRLASTNLSAAKAKLEALLQSQGAKQLIQLAGNPNPLPHGTELKRLADTQLRARENDLKRRTDQLRGLEAQHAQISGELTSKKRQRVSAESRCRDLRVELRRAVGTVTAVKLGPPVIAALQAEGKEDEAFTLALGQLERERHDKFTKMERNTAFNNLLSLVIGEAQRECKCMMCNRPFENQEQITDMLNYVEEQRMEIPERTAAYEAQIKELDRQLATMNALLGSVHGLRDLEASLPAMRSTEEQINAAVDAQSEQVDNTREELSLMEADLTALRRAVADAGWSIAKQSTEVDDAQAAADAAAASAAAAAGADSLRSLEDLDAELADLEQQQRSTDLTREDLNRRQSRTKDERMRLGERLAGVREELRKAEQANQAKQETQSQLNDADQQMSRLKGEIAAANAAVGPARSARDNLLAQRDAMRQQQLAAEGALDAQIKAVASVFDAYAVKQRVIDEYGAAAKEDSMASLAAQLSVLKARRDACGKEIAALQQELETSGTKAAENRELLKGIEAVLDYRATKRQAEQLQESMRGLQAQVDQVGDRHQLHAARAAAEEACKEAQRQRDTKQGSLGVVLEQVKKSKLELANPKYTQIQMRYRRQLIELKTTEMAAADLDKYHKALERALLAFHTGKMSDINKIVKELWQKTYRGQDIDYIQIKADAEGTARSYNYRVVMVNGGVELDMRGRCSAGQKVLACLIIRLALAETFCLNCGILALDEPTTNLDAENSASLADALRALMTARREQDNFQLVVITHDEHFAHMIGTRQHAEYLWRITKDDNQHSFIAQEEIVE